MARSTDCRWGRSWGRAASREWDCPGVTDESLRGRAPNRQWDPSRYKWVEIRVRVSVIPGIISTRLSRYCDSARRSAAAAVTNMSEPPAVSSTLSAVSYTHLRAHE